MPFSNYITSFGMVEVLLNKIDHDSDHKQEAEVHTVASLQSQLLGRLRWEIT